MTSYGRRKTTRGSNKIKTQNSKDTNSGRGRTTCSKGTEIMPEMCHIHTLEKSSFPWPRTFQLVY